MDVNNSESSYWIKQPNLEMFIEISYGIQKYIFAKNKEEYAV